jgi:hypothetical protein
MTLKVKNLKNQDLAKQARAANLGRKRANKFSLIDLFILLKTYNLIFFYY